MRAISLFCVLSAIFVTANCGGSSAPVQTSENNAAIGNANAANARPEPPKNASTPLEKALFTVRVENFEQVLVFERKDRGEFSEDDRQFLRENSPNALDRNVNRWVRCDDGKCFVAGTNNEFSRENLIALQNRFSVRDFTRSNEGAPLVLPPAETPAQTQNNNTK